MALLKSFCSSKKNKKQPTFYDAGINMNRVAAIILGGGARDTFISFNTNALQTGHHIWRPLPFN